MENATLVHIFIILGIVAWFAFKIYEGRVGEDRARINLELAIFRIPLFFRNLFLLLYGVIISLFIMGTIAAVHPPIADAYIKAFHWLMADTILVAGIVILALILVPLQILLFRYDYKYVPRIGELKVRKSEFPKEEFNMKKAFFFLFLVVMFLGTCCMHTRQVYTSSMAREQAFQLAENKVRFDPVNMDDNRIFLLKQSDAIESDANFIAFFGNYGMAIVFLDFYGYFLSGMLDPYTKFKKRTMHLRSSTREEDVNLLYSLDMLITAITSNINGIPHIKEQLKKIYGK